jgi:hypothetical protein
MLFLFCFSSHFVSVFILNKLSFPFQVNLCEIQPTIVRSENLNKTCYQQASLKNFKVIVVVVVIVIVMIMMIIIIIFIVIFIVIIIIIFIVIVIAIAIAICIVIIIIILIIIIIAIVTYIW